MEPSNKPRRIAFVAKSQSRSFARTSHEDDTAFEAANSELSSPLLSYTSLKDLMPSSPSLKCCSSSKALAHMRSAYEIPISNLLVQKAALAYLRPMPDQSNTTAVQCFSTKLLFSHLKILSSRFATAIRRVFSRISGAFHGVYDTSKTHKECPVYLGG
ncbi:hypothetical protein ACFX13_006949 [Malus domestica]|uniref:Uncharacterized protein n=1 Tax=Malus domestica TaxID=3750 RepID=A0A498IJL0_MALDO|nr:hypothetical protein DVH24_005602 [Malus domestica]